MTEKVDGYLIGHLAKMLGIHPQTLRLYEREGFVKPVRIKGNSRLYSVKDVEQIQLILHLTRDLGVNLAGVEIILNMHHKIAQLQHEVEFLRQVLTPHIQKSFEDFEEKLPSQALVKATSRKLVKLR